MVASGSRGQTGLDIILVVVMLFVFAIVAIFAYSMVSDFNTEWQGETDVANASKESMSTFSTQFPTVMDQAFAILVGLLWLALIVTSFLIDSHPAFFVVTVLILLIVFFVAMELSNYFEEIMDESEMTAFAAQFPITNWLMNNLLIVIVVMGLSAGVALYAKSQA